MNETKRKKPGPSLAFLGLLLLLSTGVSRVAAMRGPVAPENEYLIHKLNLQLPTVQESIADSSVLASEHVISVAAGTPAAPIKHITGMVQHGGHLFVAAENWLLKLNAATLAVEASVRFGPLYDSPGCRYLPVEECGQSQHQRAPKLLTNNHNKLLLVYERRRALLTCWSARQGVCELRALDDLGAVLEASATPAVANDALNSTVGFIAHAANAQDLLYVASTYNDRGPYRRDVPALAGRSLGGAAREQVATRTYARFGGGGGGGQRQFMDVLASSQGLKSSKASIEFISRFQSSFIVKYVEAFNLAHEIGCLEAIDILLI